MLAQPRTPILAMLFAVVLAAAGTMTHADTIHVDDDAPNDPGPGDPAISDPLEDGSELHPFDAIQEAIDAAVPGDEVVIADGVYTGSGNKNLDFAGKAITVRSASGDPDSCVIDCENAGRGFSFHSGEGQDSIVAGLTITNGYVTTAGGGVGCTNGSSPTLTKCTITGNTASGTNANGGGVYCYDASPTLTRCTIVGNAASGSSAKGGGLSLFFSSPTLANCTISGNAASASSEYARGGGVCCYYGSSPTLVNCTREGPDRLIHV